MSKEAKTLNIKKGYLFGEFFFDKVSANFTIPEVIFLTCI